jgi:phospholipid/cholesterol/gamma-HCH transport system permease protein
MNPLWELLRILSVPFEAVRALLESRLRGLPLVWTSFLGQIAHTAARPLLPMTIFATCIAAGCLVASAQILGKTTWSAHIPTVMVVTVARELLPLIAALTLVAQTGNQVTFQLGMMREGNEIDALHASGIDPAYFIVLPRLLGIAMGSVVLTLASATVGIFAGHALTRAATSLHDAMPEYAWLRSLGAVSYTVEWYDLVEGLQTQNMWMAVAKPFCCGLAVAAGSCHFALTADRSSPGIREAADRSTTWGYVACLTINVSLSTWALSS